MDINLIIRRILAYLLTAIIYGIIGALIYTITSYVVGDTIASFIVIIVYYVLIGQFGEIGKRITKIRLVDQAGNDVKGINLIATSTFTHLLTINLIVGALISLNDVFKFLSIIPTIYLILFIIGKDVWHTRFGYKVIEQQ